MRSPGFSRGKLQVQRRRIELGDLVQRTVEDHRSMFADAGLILNVQIRRAPSVGGRRFCSPGASHRQPVEQRGQVHWSEWPRIRRLGGGFDSRFRRHPGSRRRSRHRSGPAQACVRAVHAGGSHARPQSRWPWPRSRSYQGAGGAARRRAAGEQRRSWQGCAVRDSIAPRRSSSRGAKLRGDAVHAFPVTDSGDRGQRRCSREPSRHALFGRAPGRGRIHRLRRVEEGP